MKVSVVIPVYNEIGTVEEILSRVQAVEMEKEIIIVDDGSTDGTLERLTQKMHLKIYYDLKSAPQAALRKSILTLKYSNIPAAKIASVPCL